MTATSQTRNHLLVLINLREVGKATDTSLEAQPGRGMRAGGGRSRTPDASRAAFRCSEARSRSSLAALT
jgi:hypothetical protein